MQQSWTGAGNLVLHHCLSLSDSRPAGSIAVCCQSMWKTIICTELALVTPLRCHYVDHASTARYLHCCAACRASSVQLSSHAVW